MLPKKEVIFKVCSSLFWTWCCAHEMFLGKKLSLSNMTGFINILQVGEKLTEEMKKVSMAKFKKDPLLHVNTYMPLQNLPLLWNRSFPRIVELRKWAKVHGYEIYFLWSKTPRNNKGKHSELPTCLFSLKWEKKEKKKQHHPETAEKNNITHAKNWDKSLTSRHKIFNL